jgi:hypothetical protein
MKIETFNRDQTSADLGALASDYEQTYSVSFSSLTVLPAGYLHALHATRREALPVTFRVISREQPDVGRMIDSLAAIANDKDMTREKRLAYRETLEHVYRSIGIDAARTQFSGALWVAPEREGRILAERLGCLTATHSVAPIAKRMPYKGGIAVGVDMPQLQAAFSDCVIVDGAIASGATLIALIERLKRTSQCVWVYAAHCTVASLWGLATYAETAGVELHVVVGHASGVLNAKFYAVSEDDPRQLMVGDLGDTISDL